MSDYWLHRHGALSGDVKTNVNGSKDIDDKWLHRHGAYDFGNLSGSEEEGGSGYPVYPYDVYDCQGHEGTYDESTLTATINGIDYKLDLEAKTCEIPDVEYDYPYSPECDDGELILDWIVVNGERYFLTSIGDSALNTCNTVVSLVIGNSVTTLSEGAFEGCENLVSVVIGRSVSTWGNDVFNACRKLKSVILLDGVTSIGYLAFTRCNSFESIVIPDSVTFIERAFYSGTSFTIYYKGTEEQWDAITKISGWDSNCTITMVYNYTD